MTTRRSATGACDPPSQPPENVPHGTDDAAIAALQRTVREQADTIATLAGGMDVLRQALSHDLRAPLRAITGFSALLREDAGDGLPAQWGAYLDHIHRAASRMSEQIEALLQLVEVSRRPLVPVRLDLGALAREILAGLAQRDRTRVVAVQVADGAHGVGDEGLLRVVLEVLLDNAWRFTAAAPDARIEFGVARDETGVPEYFVRDNGIGFDTACTDLLFEPFRRLHAQSEGGRGIGLALARSIVQRHGGRIRADAHPGGGALFAFTLASGTKAACGAAR